MQGKKILLVEDNDDIRYLLKMELTSAGYEVIEAPEGRTGLQAYKESRPDLLVLDYMMPGMSGAEMAVEARAAQPDLPVVLITAYGGVFDVGISGWTAPTALLSKPVEFPVLLNRIERMLAS